MQYTVVKDLSWADAANTMLDCTVVTGGRELPFTASATDAASSEIFGKAIAGAFGEIAAYEAPPEPAPAIPNSVTRRQILTGLAFVGWITEAEAEAALATGARPAAVDAVISALPVEQQFHARMKWIGFQSAYRNDGMVAALAGIEGKTEQDIDEFFSLCASIE